MLDIIESFKSSLKHINWMDKESADAAAGKVSIYYYPLRDLPELSSGRRHPRQSRISTFTRYTQPSLDRELLFDSQDP